MCLAIDHIRNCQLNERQLATELQRLQRDSDYGREAHKENEMLKTEIQVMHQTLRRLDPNATHMYGHFTSQLSQPAGHQTNGASAISLPPIASQGPQAPYSTFTPPAAAMQGVEYGGR